MQSPRHAKAQARAIWPPSPGLFSVSFTRGAWKVPARIVLTGGLWYAEIDEEEYEAHSDPALAPRVGFVWHRGVRIDQVAYDWLLVLKDWARANYPDHPCLSPYEAIDPNKLRPMLPAERAL
jgi:hypothetical protein